MIDRATFNRIAPELLNQPTPAAVVQQANGAGELEKLPELAPEAFARGVAWALRVERNRIGSLLEHFAKQIPDDGERLARRVVFTVRKTSAALRKAWRDSAAVQWQ